MRSLASLAVGMLCGCLAATDCAALDTTFLPPIPVLPAQLVQGPGGVALATSMSGAISIIDPNPLPGVVNSLAGSYSSPLGFTFGGELREQSDSRAVGIGNTSGRVSTQVRAEPGKLRGYASAGGGGGAVNGLATATALFVDVVRLGLDGGYIIDWNVHGTVSGGYAIQTPDVRPLTRPAAGANIQAKVWWIPFGVNLAQASQSRFLGSLYTASSWVYDLTSGTTKIIDEIVSARPGNLGSALLDVPAGTKFWVIGTLDVTAVRGSGSGVTVLPTTDATGIADFMNTVELTVQSVRAPGEPGVVTSLSGHDYAPAAVPEPASVLLFACGGAVLLVRRRRPASHGDGTVTRARARCP